MFQPYKLKAKPYWEELKFYLAEKKYCVAYLESKACHALCDLAAICFFKKTLALIIASNKSYDISLL